MEWSLVVCFVVLTLGGSSGVEVCNRMALTGLDTDSTPYVQFAGVYELQDYEHDNFAVLKNRNNFLRGNVFFFYDASSGRFAFGATLGRPILLSALPTSTFSQSTWRRYVQQDRPFSSLIGSWFQRLPLTLDTWEQIYGDIAFKCVDDDYQACNSGRLEFDRALMHPGKGADPDVYFNIPGQHYYEMLPDTFKYNRPVYKQRNTTFDPPYYLCFSALRKWVIQRGFPQGELPMYISDKALTPEEITEPDWLIYSGRQYEEIPAKLRCQGVSTILGQSCASNDMGATCRNGGTCHLKSTGEAVCLCTDGFYGVTCSKAKAVCPASDLRRDESSTSTDYRHVLDSGRYAGGIATFFCQRGSEPTYFYAVCVAKSGQVAGDWKGIGERYQGCRVSATTPLYRRTRSPRSTRSSWPTRLTYSSWPRYTQPYEEPDWLYGVVVVTLSLIQYAVPPLMYFLLAYISNRLDKKHAVWKDDQAGILLKELEAKRDKITAERDIGKITPDQAVVQYAELARVMEERDQQNKELRQKVKAKRKVKNIGFFRIYSLAFNIGFWVWITIVSACDTIKDSDTADGVKLLGFWSLGIAYGWVFFETLLSREFGYLKRLNKVEYAAVYLAELRKTAPHLIMRAVCYHYETRTRIVYYTDANGNQNSRIETYQERVVTHTDAELFRYSYWTDTSDNTFSFSNSFGVTKIKLKRTIYPGDAITRQALTDAENTFKDRNRHYDTFMDYDMEIAVNGFEKRLAAYTDPARKAWWISSGHFLVATIFGLSWVYRWVFRARTGRARYKLEKRIYMTPPEQADEVACDVIAYNIDTVQQRQLCLGTNVASADDNGKQDGTKKSNDKKDKEGRTKAPGDHDNEVVNITTGATTVNRY